jgi:hypothetical protein
MLMATIPSASSANAPRLLMMRGYAEFPTRLTLAPENLFQAENAKSVSLPIRCHGVHKHNNRGLPRPSDADDNLVLMNTVSKHVALQLIPVVFHKPKHVVGGNPALLHVTACGVDARVRRLRKAWLERKERRYL